MPGITHDSNVLTSPVWAADYLSRDHLVPGPIELDPAQFLNEDGVTFTVQINDAAATAGDTTITVDALAGAIPSGTVLDFGAQLAKLSANAASGATTLTVDALESNIADNATATYTSTGVKKKRVVAGTYVGRTFAERETDDPFGPVASGDEERFLVAFDILDLNEDESGTAVRHGAAIKENFLPAYAAMDATILGYLRADYTTQKGVA